MSEQLIREIRKLFAEGKTVRQVRLALAKLGLATLDEKSDQVLLQYYPGKESAK